MKKRLLIIALTLVLTVGLGATAYAATGAGRPAAQGFGLGKTIPMRGYDYIISVLENKYGLTEAEINSERNSGKTLWDIAEEKGITADELRTALIEERTKAVDEAVENGTLTKDQGDAIKANMSNCTGIYCQGQCQGQFTGRGRGMMGRGQRGINSQNN